MLPATTVREDTSLQQMRTDAELPADVEPASGPLPALRTVLLTGATGFVGAHLLHTLLRETSAHVVCLVRGMNAMERLRGNLEKHARWEPAWAERIGVMASDLARPRLGLNETQQQQLSEDVDVIFHGGATVNWVRPYPRLRAANVLGMLELLRLACKTRPKPFHFLSTISVCYATAGAGTLTEADDPWPLADQLHLGYAQSKVVAEQLVRQAAARGLPTVTYRPALITGDSETGAANADDFLARGIGACVRMGCAPDVDWCIDAPPVDHVARVMVRHATAAPPGRAAVLHLVHPQPRHWQELLLWMRLYGYPLQLLPYHRWLRRLEHTARARAHPLYPLLGFFRARVGELTLPETYLGRRRTCISAERTLQTLARMDVSCPSLDARWLERFFRSLTAHGVVPPCPGRSVSGPSYGTEAWDAHLPALLRRSFNDPTLEVHRAGPATRLSQQSILTELTSWRRGAVAGLFRQPLRLVSRHADVPAELDVVIKIKMEDQHLLDVAEAAAALCHRKVGEAFTRWRSRLGLAGGHLREIALYGQEDERWRRHTPRVYGAEWHEEQRSGLIVLEDLSAGAWMDPCTDAVLWRPAQIEAAVRGLAQLHAIWLGRDRALAAQPWLGPVLSAADMVEMSDLWHALANHAARFFVPWLGPDVRRVQRRLLTRLERWWRPLEQLPHTLVHNDFNPRNLALRPTLCAYDWELATSAVPQHDLAQLLCFVLPADCARATVQHYLELHRRSLATASGHALDPADWQHGFGLALADLLINRLALYSLVHAIRRQPFLERVLQTWRTLYAYYPASGAA